MGSEITVLVSCSPIKSHPSTEIIQECIDSVMERLPESRIIVMADGVRPELSRYAENYFKFLTRLKKLYPDLLVFRAPAHLHQAAMTKLTLPDVDTPVILFIEHDMALQGDIPVDTIIKRLEDSDLVRLLYEDNDLINFKHMLKEKHGDFTQTKQWSQRPHFARTEYYRMILDKYFTRDSRTYIEDRMHGVIDSEDNWNAHKLWVYTPPLPVNRFKINDGRDGDPKYDQDLIY